MSVYPFLTPATVCSVGLICKGFLNLGFCNSVRVDGLHHLVSELDSEDRKKGKGLVTVANHISVLDDPLAWGILPVRTYLNPRKMRWSLGASEIMFINPIASQFFRQGQVLETFRGQGIYQDAVNVALKKLDEGGWIHLFGEGKVNQPKVYPVVNGVARLPRFKWGVGRVLMEAKQLPTILPIWLTGFDHIMPDNRPPPRFLPSFNQDLTVTIGPPMDLGKFQPVLDRGLVRAQVTDPSRNPLNRLVAPVSEHGEEERAARILVTDIVQREVEALGYRVSGPLLGKARDALPPQDSETLGSTSKHLSNFSQQSRVQASLIPRSTLRM